MPYVWNEYADPPGPAGERSSLFLNKLGITVYTRLYKLLVTVPPLTWVALFLIAPYGFLFCFSFWSVQSQTVVRHWNLNNYRQLVENPVYVQVLLRSMRIAGMVTVLSLVLSFPLAYFLSFHAPVSYTHLTLPTKA